MIRYLSHMRAVNTKTSLRKFTDLSEPSLLAHTNQGRRRTFRPKITSLSPRNYRAYLHKHKIAIGTKSRLKSPILGGVGGWWCTDIGEWYPSFGDREKCKEIIAIRYLTFYSLLNRGSYMSAHVLLNLLNELGKRDKMRGLPRILYPFRNEFNKFNNTGARM